MKRCKVLLGIAAGAVFCAAGCSTGGGPDVAPPSQLEMRSLQTRLYETDNPRVVMKAMVNVLQDLGFMLKTADTDLGVVTAEKWTDIEHSKKEIRAAKKDESLLAESIVLECTANVSPYGAQCRVRVSFQKRVLGPAGSVLEARPVQDTAFYQEFFLRADKGVFLQMEGM